MLGTQLTQIVGRDQFDIYIIFNAGLQNGKYVFKANMTRLCTFIMLIKQWDIIFGYTIFHWFDKIKSPGSIDKSTIK